MDKFVYDEKTRIHRLGNAIIPSVTQVLAPLSDYSKIPPAVLERKTQLGIEFHKAVEYYLEGFIDDISVDPAIEMPFKTFVEWWKQQPDKDRIVLKEVPVVHEEYRYCGKPDIVTKDRIVDIKLRPYNAITDPLQLAGYAECLVDRLGTVGRRTVASFDLRGGITVHDAYHRQAWAMFAVMLNRFKTLEKSDKLIADWKAEAMR